MSKKQESFEEWWSTETPELGIDFILATKNKSKNGKLTRDMIVTALECVWSHQQKKIDERDKRIAELEKENRYMRASLNRLHADVSNGEHLDKNWIKDVLIAEPRCQTLDAFNNKCSKLQSELDKRDRALGKIRPALEYYSFRRMGEGGTARYALKEIDNILKGEEG